MKALVLFGYILFFLASSWAQPSCPADNIIDVAFEWKQGSGHHATIGDVDNDGIPEAVGYRRAASAFNITDGQTGIIENVIAIPINNTPIFTVWYVSPHVMADVNNDNISEIFFIHKEVLSDGSADTHYYINSLSADGTVQWSQEVMTTNLPPETRMALSIADFDQDGNAEIFDNAGNIWDATTGNFITSINGIEDLFPATLTAGTPPCYWPGEGTLAFDVLPVSGACPDCDGLELIIGKHIYSVDLGTPALILEQTAPIGSAHDMYRNSIADIDLDGDLDIVLSDLFGTNLYIWDPTTATILDQIDLSSLSAGISSYTGNCTAFPPPGVTAPASNSVGRSNLSNIDGDTELEILVYYGGGSFMGGIDNYLYALDYSSMSGITEKWVLSGIGSQERKLSPTVFDLNGDGQKEVIAVGEGTVDTLRIVDGLTGGNQLHLKVPHSMGTQGETGPMIVDVDDDGQVEIVLNGGYETDPSNYPSLPDGSQSNINTITDGTGVLTVVGGCINNWICGRQTWHQQVYNPTNINDDLSVPPIQNDHHLDSLTNNFGSQILPYDAGGNLTCDYPDATIDLVSVVALSCDSSKVYFEVCNIGSELFPISPNCPEYITFYINSPFNGADSLMTVHIPEMVIAPGDCYSDSISFAYSGDFMLHGVVNDYFGQTVAPLLAFGEEDCSNNFDSIQISVPTPLFTATTQLSTDTVCINQDVSIDVTVVPNNVVYTFDWSPTTNVSLPNTEDVTITGVQPGTNYYNVNITEPGGCEKGYVIAFEVLPGTKPNLSVGANPMTITCGDTVSLTSELNDSKMSYCGLIDTTCSSSPITAEIGVGTFNFPRVFFGAHTDNRIQMLYNSEELLAAGMTTGKISEIQFNVVTKNSTTPFENFTVRIGCADKDSLADFFNPSAQFLFQTGLQQVYFGDYSTMLGWNSIIFQDDYHWDGFSDLVVEICYDNPASGGADPIASTNVGIRKVLNSYESSLTLSGCQLNENAISYFAPLRRPNIRFINCEVPADTSQFTYNWTPSFSITNPTYANTMAMPIENTTYQLIVADLNSGCSDTADVSIVVSEIPAPDVMTDTVYCSGETIADITSLGTGVSYWFDDQALTNNVGNGVTFSPFNTLGTTTYYAVDSLNGCVSQPDSAVIVINSTPVEPMILGGGTFCENVTLPDLTTSSTGTIYWFDDNTLLNNIGIGDTMALTNLTGTFEFFAIDSLNNCGSSVGMTTVTINPTSVGVDVISACDSLTWIDGITYFTSTTIPTHLLTNVHGCDSIISLDLTIHQSSSVSLSESICDGDIFTSPAGNSYMTSEIITDTLTGVWGCDSIFIIDLQVLSGPPNAEILNSDTLICVNSNSFLLNSSNLGGDWSGAGVDVLNGFFDPQIAGVGIHDVYYTIANSCGSNVDSIDVAVVTIPFATGVVINDNCGASEGAISLSVEGGSPPYDYSWNSGETESSLFYLVANTYEVMISDQNQCSIAETFTVDDFNQDCPFNIYVPNVFSPDGNGENDILYVRGKGIEELRFSIYNRWGQLIFQSYSLDAGWDGTYKGKNVNPGVFVYTIEAKYSNGEEVEEKGNVTVVR